MCSSDLVAGKQEKAGGFAAWDEMHIEIVAERCSGGWRVSLMLLGELVELGMSLGIDDEALFDPADLLLIGLYLEEAASMLDDLERLPVDYLGHAIGDGGYAVVNVGLLRGDVDGLWLAMAKTAAS